ncbi:MAG: ATP-binding protein, partial [Alphaproteobacteria bacterium]|nr:ATP-binding protein [Alphaproteobacteria bacterium]
MEKINFRANAGIKDILGQGLIYDDNIAIIELVKNSKDAGSDKVEIEFNFFDVEDFMTNGSDSNINTIFIKDYGSGMSLNDINEKWLNMAYSEKKGNKAKDGSNYAGNKGVGRFSCDRLGSFLEVFTKSKQGNYLKIAINWLDFENKGKEHLVSDIKLNCESLSRENFIKQSGTDKNFKTGTILKISNIRNEWADNSLIKLVYELEKFSPTLDKGFEVYFYVKNLPEKRIHDDLKNKIDKKIENNILDKLSFKTTHIKSSISEDGKEIKTTLFFQQEEIYNYVVKNPYKTLKNIKVEIHYLDTLNKKYFTQHIAEKKNTSQDYGSIFLFYNGFRVSPYGNFKNDWLGLDQRKSQGVARNLGTREVIGKIEIEDSENKFSIVSSREGVVKNKAYLDLVAHDKEQKTKLLTDKYDYGYVICIIRQLEKFVVDGLDWSRIVAKADPNNLKKKSITEEMVVKNPDLYMHKSIDVNNVKKVAEKIATSSWGVENLHLNTNLVDRIKSTMDKKYKDFVDKFCEEIGNKTISELNVNDKTKVKRFLDDAKHKVKIAEKERDFAEEKQAEAEDTAKKEKEKSSILSRQNKFLEKLSSPEQTLDALITHVVKQVSGGIEKDMKSILSQYYKNNESVSIQDLIEVIEYAIIDISTIKEASNLAMNADFDLKVSSIKDDLFAYISEYIQHVSRKNKKWGVSISVTNESNYKKEISFNPV